MTDPVDPSVGAPKRPLSPKDIASRIAAIQVQLAELLGEVASGPYVARVKRLAPTNEGDAPGDVDWCGHPVEFCDQFVARISDAMAALSAPTGENNRAWAQAMARRQRW